MPYDLPFTLYRCAPIVGPWWPFRAQMRYPVTNLLGQTDSVAGFFPVLTKLKQSNGNSLHVDMLHMHTMQI